MTATVKALRIGETKVNVVKPRSRYNTFPEGPFELKFSRRLTDQELLAFSAENDHLRIEEDKNGTLIIMPPVDFDGGAAESTVHGLLYLWWSQFKKGKTFSPSTGFKLPDGATRSADGCWVSDTRLAQVLPAERKKFARIVPDFVIEVRSTSDRIGKLKKKMTDTWIKNGVRLAWLIDPIAQKAYVYREDGTMETMNSFDEVLNGEAVCPGFQLDLKTLKI